MEMVQGPVIIPELGWAFVCSRRGFQHQLGNLPCQDACGVWTGTVAASGCVVVAVADGHGDARHDLSHLGAWFAVRAAVDEFLSLKLSLESSESRASLVSTFKNIFPRALVRRWRDLVAMDGKQRTGHMSDSEDDLIALSRRYGSTLIALMLTPERLFLVQIGDGDLLHLRNDGPLEHPFPPFKEQVGSETDSLASREASKLVRTMSMKAVPGDRFLLATDGLANAMDGDQLETFTRGMFNQFEEHGHITVANAVPTWLDAYSNRGSGDDISLAVLSINSSTADAIVTPEAVDISLTPSDEEVKGGGYAVGDWPEG